MPTSIMNGIVLFGSLPEGNGFPRSRTSQDRRVAVHRGNGGRFHKKGPPVAACKGKREMFQ